MSKLNIAQRFSDFNIYESKYLLSEKLEKRDYQESIVRSCIGKSSLIILPTGLGKTQIAILISIRCLELFPDHKIIMLAPTKPLVVQHANRFKEFINPKYFDISIEKNVLTGSTDIYKRVELFKSQSILFYTPQTLKNDLDNNLYDLNDVGLIIFDEAHRAKGNYAYCVIAKLFRQINPKGIVLGLTASPGSNKEEISELCNNLNIPMENIMIRDEKDKDTKEYVNKIQKEVIGVESSNLMIQITKLLNQMKYKRFQALFDLGFLDIPQDSWDKIYFSELQKIEMENIKPFFNINKNAGDAISLTAQIKTIMFMISTVELEGLFALDKFITENLNKNTKASYSIKTDPLLLQIKNILNKNKVENVNSLIHPKMTKLKEILLKELNLKQNSRGIVFAQHRNAVITISDYINKIDGIRSIKFVGQATKSKTDVGLSQKEQIEILNDFKNGKFNVLVATSVAEEGLDIIECSFVVFYDNVPSAIKKIQRQGRTGRRSEGKVYYLYTKGTIDEKYLKLSEYKTYNMKNAVKAKIKNQNNLNNEDNHINPIQISLSATITPGQNPKSKRNKMLIENPLSQNTKSENKNIDNVLISSKNQAKTSLDTSTPKNQKSINQNNNEDPILKSIINSINEEIQQIKQKEEEEKRKEKEKIQDNSSNNSPLTLKIYEKSNVKLNLKDFSAQYISNDNKFTNSSQIPDVQLGNQIAVKIYNAKNFNSFYLEYINNLKFFNSYFEILRKNFNLAFFILVLSSLNHSSYLVNIFEQKSKIHIIILQNSNDVNDLLTKILSDAINKIRRK